jgi:glucose-6-phosphate isomerase/transaldolase/glucose-6-phosphate isomerase
MEIYKQKGQLPALTPTVIADNMLIFADPKQTTNSPASSAETVLAFLKGADPAGYVSLQAFLAPSAETDLLLQELRKAIWGHTNTATTLGYGPRYLHSTGQLHKGDAGKGSFIQLTNEITEDLPIPDLPGANAFVYTFGTLIQAQALGDRQALLDAGRRVLRVHLVGDVRSGLQELVDILRRQHA